MPEGSGLGGENAEVRIVWTSLRRTTGAAEAEDAGQSSVPDAATKTAHTKRRTPADDVAALLGGIKVADQRLDPFELLRYGGDHHVQALPRLL